MMNLTNEFSVGDDKIDNQHKELFIRITKNEYLMEKSHPSIRQRSG